VIDARQLTARSSKMPDDPTLDQAEAAVREARERLLEVSAVLRKALADDEQATATENGER
jgi:hypothetical protein